MVLSILNKLHSIVTQLVNLTDKLTINANNRHTTGAVFLDVEKAFDRVWHQGLLNKLLVLDTPIPLIKIIKSFLENRTFRVKTDNISSNLKPTLADVPQGSCLSPFLYLAYTNDIPTFPGTNLALFADDTIFYFHDKNAYRTIVRLQRQIDLASIWFNKWRLAINVQKNNSYTF